MGVNRYMIPAEYKARQTYVPQYVPLPIDDLDKAMKTKQAELDKMTAFGEEASALSLNPLKPDEIEYANWKKGVDDEVDRLTDLTLADTLPGKGYGKTRKDFIKFKQRVKRDLDPRLGKAGSIKSARDAHDAFFKKVDESDMSKSEKSAMKALYQSAYAEQGGIGTPSGESGAYQQYGTGDIAKRVDIYKTYGEGLAAKMKAAVRNNTVKGSGFWDIVKKYGQNDVDLESWQQLWKKNTAKFKTLAPQLIEKVVRAAIMGDQDAVDFISQRAELGTLEKNPEGYYHRRDHRDPKFQEAFNSILNNYVGVLGQTYKQSEIEYDQDMKLFNFKDAGSGAGKKAKTPDNPLISTTDAIQKNHPMLNKGTKKMKDGANFDQAFASSAEATTNERTAVNTQVKELFKGVTNKQGKEYTTEDMLADLANGTLPVKDNGQPVISSGTAQTIKKKVDLINRDESNLKQIKANHDYWVRESLGDETNELLDNKYVVKNAKETITNLAVGTGIAEGKATDIINDLLNDRTQGGYTVDKKIEAIRKDWNEEKNQDDFVHRSSSIAPGLAHGPGNWSPGSAPQFHASKYKKYLMNKGYSESDVNAVLGHIKNMSEDDANKLEMISHKRDRAIEAKQRMSDKYVNDNKLNNVTLDFTGATAFPIYSPVFKTDQKTGQQTMVGRKRDDKGINLFDDVNQYLSDNPGFYDEVQLSWGNTKTPMTINDWAKEYDTPDFSDKGANMSVMYSHTAHVPEGATSGQPGYIFFYKFGGDVNDGPTTATATVPFDRLRPENIKNMMANNDPGVLAGFDLQDLKTTLLLAKGSATGHHGWEDKTNYYGLVGTEGEFAGKHPKLFMDKKSGAMTMKTVGGTTLNATETEEVLLRHFTGRRLGR
jgi:hypothetical protein